MLLNTNKIKFINMSDIDAYHVDFDWKVSLSDIITSAEDNGLDLRDEEILIDYLKTVGFDTDKVFRLTDEFTTHRNLHNAVVSSQHIEGFADEEYMLDNGIWTVEVAKRKYKKYQDLLEDFNMLQSQGNNLFSETVNIAMGVFEDVTKKEKGKNRTAYSKKDIEFFAESEKGEQLREDINIFLENEGKEGESLDE